MSKQIEQQRGWMKSNFEQMEGIVTDQEKKVPYPPLSKGVEEGLKRIKLPEVKESMLASHVSTFNAIIDRCSHRKFADETLTLDELSFLLFGTQGVRKFKEGKFSMRTVPSGGARHPFETYLAVFNVEGLDAGMYRYEPFEHELIYLFDVESMSEKISDATLGQKFVGLGAVTFIWSCIPYRSEWRYHIASHKTMLLDAGHICQNLYIACETVGCGTCGIAAYDQKKIDSLIQVDGEDEFVVYLAPVGKRQK